MAEQDFHLKRFDERYKIYRQKMNEIESDPEAPQDWAAILGRTVIRTTYIVGDMVPGLRKGLEYVPQESLETQAGDWATYLAKKFTNKDENLLVRNPVPILTSLFFEDLKQIAQRQCILLCFENFEATRQELQEWLLRLPEYRPSQNIRIAIAGRDRPGAKWDALRSVTKVINLDVFTEQEAEAMLDVYGITDTQRRVEILEWSGRLPVLMSWLAAPQGDAADLSVPTRDIVERFLRWVTEPIWRQVALLAAIPRTFNVDILNLILRDRLQDTDGISALDWLQTMPFVQQRSDGWHYHDVVRRMILQHQRQTSPLTYREIHALLANFYKSKCDNDGDEWAGEEWRKDMLSYLYHYLISDPTRHWDEIVDLLALAVRKHRNFSIEIGELLNVDDIHSELSQKKNNLVDLLCKQLSAMKNGRLQDGFEMFDQLCAMTNLSAQAKCYVYAYRGECYRQNGEWKKAHLDFDKALDYVAEDTWAISRRGQTYRLMKRYEEALIDFDRAIAVNDSYNWAITNRSLTYQAMERYEEALVDLDRAIVQDDKNSWAFAHRGETYRAMERYEEALIDFDRAIAVSDSYNWAITNRSLTYQAMERYEEALIDFDRAIVLDDKNARIIANRGETYRLMKRYEEALIDFDRAIVLDNTTTNNYYNERGLVLSYLGSYAEAIDSYDSGLKRKPDS